MKTYKVLLIDDDMKELEKHSRALSGERCTIHGVRSRAEASAFLKKNRGKVVVLSEFHAGGESMLDFMKEVRKEYPALPFSFLVSSPSTESAVEAMKAGAVDYLGKPASTEVLRRAVEESASRMKRLLDTEKLGRELRRRHSRNQDELQAARTLSSFKGFMISMAAHDFRTILTVLDGYLRFLREKCGSCPVNAKDGVARRANRTVARLLSMANTLLDFEAAETGRIRLDIRSFPLEETLQECLVFYKSYAETKRVNLFLSPGSEGIIVRGDREKVMEILDNLIYNALKFTPAEGSIHLSGKKENGYSAITVTDSGPGIPEDKLKNLIDPESMIAAMDAHARLGLGLKICQRLAEAQNGKIEVNSVCGKGTMVSLRLPAE